MWMIWHHEIQLPSVALFQGSIARVDNLVFFLDFIEITSFSSHDPYRKFSFFPVLLRCRLVLSCAPWLWRSQKCCFVTKPNYTWTTFKEEGEKPLTRITNFISRKMGLDGNAAAASRHRCCFGLAYGCPEFVCLLLKNGLQKWTNLEDFLNTHFQSDWRLRKKLQWTLNKKTPYEQIVMENSISIYIFCYHASAFLSPHLMLEHIP